MSEFHRWNRGDGYQPWCKPCRKVYDAAYNARTRERRRARRPERRHGFNAWYLSLKDGPCADCGNRFAPAVMHFDRLPGAAKVANVGDLARRMSRRRILEEIEKCELVCANCHAIRTVSRREHGA